MIQTCNSYWSSFKSKTRSPLISQWDHLQLWSFNTIKRGYQSILDPFILCFALLANKMGDVTNECEGRKKVKQTYTNQKVKHLLYSMVLFYSQTAGKKALLSFEKWLERLRRSFIACSEANVINLSTIVYALFSHLCCCFDFVMANTVTELPDELIMGPGFGNMTLSNCHKISLSVNGKWWSFSFHRVTQTQTSTPSWYEWKIWWFLLSVCVLAVLAVL